MNETILIKYTMRKIQSLCHFVDKKKSTLKTTISEGASPQMYVCRTQVPMGMPKNQFPKVIANPQTQIPNASCHKIN